jgi:hypothetical protein
MDNWIDVNDRLPEHDDYVLVATKYGEMQVCYYSKYQNTWYIHNYKTGIEYEVHYDIKYWRNLPEFK